MSLFGGLFGGGGDPDSDLQQIPQYYKQYLAPYANAGMGYEKFLGPLLEGLMRNPTALQDQIMSHYQESPYAKYQTGEVTNQMNRSAALGGNLGSPNEQADMAGRVQGVVSGDQQNYLHNAMQPYLAGMQSLMGLTNLGENAGGQIANMYGDLYSNMAGMDAAQNGQNQNLLGGLLGMGGSMLMRHYMPPM